MASFVAEGMRSNPHFNPAAVSDLVVPLTEDEIEKFIDELDHDKDGHVSYAELEKKLDAVNEELTPNPQAHHLNHDSKAASARHAFLRSMYGSQEDRISREDFKKQVRSWKVPSQKQEEAEEESQKEYMRKLGWSRRFRSYWAVHGPTIVFMFFVTLCVLSFAIWQLVKYTTNRQYRNALGWGIVMAKTSAGALYMTFFFLLLSMSRYFSTALRRSYRVSRFINWDLSQTFHIIMSCLALTFATTHSIGHLAGDFVWGGNNYQPGALDTLLGDRRPALQTYGDYIGSLPGATGVSALVLFYILAAFSLPVVRKWSYEAFQLAHLLMFPIIGLGMAHGTLHLLQWPMFGYFLAFPTLLILIERIIRITRGFIKIPATIEILDNETVEIRATIPKSRIWKYAAGQYLFLQVPALSRFQFHPFTISVCDERELQLHIKTDGNWTGKLRGLASKTGKTNIDVGIDGPFGAPAQRFYDFSHTILVGAGIGVTPFSGILADLQVKENKKNGGPTDEAVNGVAGGGEDGRDMSEKRAERQNSGGSALSDATRAEKEGAVNAMKKELGQVTEPKRKGSGRADLLRQRSGDGVGTSGFNSPIGNSGPNSRNASSTSLSSLGQSISRTLSRTRSRAGRARNMAPADFPDDYRRTDFHWIVRDKNYLNWFSDLLNSISRSQIWHRQHPSHTGAYPHLDIRMWTHVTQKRKNISTHIYRWLLELHRTPEHPESPLTGLINPTHYGRPDFVRILDDHYADMMRYRTETGWDQDGDGENDRFKVGVFFCGTPIVGEVLADRCRLLTARGRADGSNIEYYFMIEVFG